MSIIADFELSPVGLGTAALGRDADEWGVVDDNESIATIQAALELGLNWIECSPDYGVGHAERLAGLALQEQGDRVRIVARTPRLDSDAGSDAAGRHDWILRSCEASRRRIGVEVIDLFICALPLQDHLLAATTLAMRTLWERGMIRAIGVAGADSAMLARWRNEAPLHAVTAPFNLLEREASRDLREWTAANEIAFLACSPLCRGLLTETTYNDEPTRGIRARDRQFRRPRLPENKIVRDQLADLAQRNEMSLVQLAINWALSRTGVSSVIVGAKVVSQLRASAALVEPGRITAISGEIEQILTDRDIALRRVL